MESRVERVVERASASELMVAWKSVIEERDGG